MAEYYGSVQGGRGEAHRLGNKKSGITTCAKSWVTEVNVEYSWDDAAKETRVRVTAKHERRGTVVLFDGPESEIENMIVVQNKG